LWLNAAGWAGVQAQLDETFFSGKRNLVAPNDLESAMARFKREDILAAFQPHLQPGEEITHHAFGVKQPHFLLLVGLIFLGILPGIIAVFLLTKEYVVAMTNRRVIILQVKGKLNVKEMREFALGSVPPATTSTGGLFTHIKVQSEPPFVAKFHRMGLPNNREDAMAIGAALSGQALPGAA
jgi:hypothetical protein